MRSSLPLAIALALAAPACVVGAERRPSRVEAARAPLDPAEGAPHASLRGESGCAGATPAPVPPRPSPDAVWIDGDCHWDGVRYVWVDGRWQARRPEARR